MFDHALETVPNLAVRQDLLKARAVLEQNGGFDEAFDKPETVEARFSQIIATSAIAGKLDSGLDYVVALATDRLEYWLDLFCQGSLRLMGYAIAMSIAGTVWFCLTYSRGR